MSKQMNDELVVEEIVTKFILNTCRLRPQLTMSAVQAAMWCSEMATTPSTEPEVAVIPLTTGSIAEFYIEPMIPHIGDVDLMYHWNTQLAIPQGHPPPTQLPDEFHNYVSVYEITDSHLPGYVYLELGYSLTECADGGKYNAVKEYDKGLYAANVDGLSSEFVAHGPARVIDRGASYLTVDGVRCVRCLVWPSQAAHWPTRHRNYDWPDSATVDRVVSNGCDVVGVAHRQYKQHEWVGKFQWRLSFSRAEIVLLNSWMPVQQIVYHLLRVYAKTERFTESGDNAVTLSNYHFKTLMLWACELKPRIWWTDDLSLTRICVELLHELAVWLTEARCLHYFINNCNLVDSSFNLGIMSSQLLSISKSWLSLWFVNNYIRRCSQLCTTNVSRLFDDANTRVKLRDAVSAIVDWRLETATMDMWEAFESAVITITLDMSKQTVTVRLLDYWMSEWKNINKSLRVYLISVVLLHAACKTSRSGLNDELMDVLSVIVRQSIGPRRYSSTSRLSSGLLLSKAVKQMKAVDDRPTSRSTVQLIAIELSKAYLYRALCWEDSDSDSTYCLANVYLAVLYYTTEQYQMAIDHCALVMRSKDHLQCSSRVVQGEILPKTDDDLDIALGVAVFYQHVRIAALNQQRQQPQYVTVFNTELLAHYLHIKCLSVTKCQQLSDTTNSRSSTDEVQSYAKCITDMKQQLFIADVLLWMLLERGFSSQFASKQQYGVAQHAIMYQSELNTTHLVELLQKSAVEHLTIFRQFEERDFGSEVTIVTKDFEAMYSYKHGDYQECLLLSTQNVHTLAHADEMTSILATPEFIQLLDDDIVSLTAATLIADPECRYRPDDRCASVTQLTLSLYLMTQCQLKLRHSVTSLVESVVCVEFAHRRHPVMMTLDRLVLKMIAHKAVTYITAMMNKVTTHNSP